MSNLNPQRACALVRPLLRQCVCPSCRRVITKPNGKRHAVATQFQFANGTWVPQV